ncbi:recQ-mediated genome instability protein 1-like isoform X1 [Danaus plexippus]|uniref:recQ-mediated genome instability protein 1-like isoform X1 n=1 Tax=Danaus plexippus TaxID=13037 RepID=UPI002AB10977|nr:recQ-mediated genome instability protein 1-like isoform X1 [Danaus plexippus]
MLLNEIVESVKLFLKNSHINVKHDWLQGCIEYLHEKGYDPNSISKITKEQWLLNDLKEVSLGCLPSNLKKQSLVILDGNFVLQVNSEINISMSVYQQYSKLKNVNNENIEATITTEEKITSNRILKFFLTDGVQDVTAIEYKCINKIKNDLNPGYKILVKGPVVCRNGVIFLTDKDVDMMWGEVKEFSITNSKISILAAKLGLSDAISSVNNQSSSVENRNQIVFNENITAESTLNRFERQNNTTDQQNRNINEIDIPQNQNRNERVEEFIDLDDYEEIRQDTPADLLADHGLEDNSPAFNTVKVSASPFVYIKQINDLNQCERINKVFKVKAQILYLLKRPSFTKDKWMVECRITDGTGCLNVEVNSCLFSTIISHTPQEMAELSLQRQKDPATKDRIDRDFVKYLSEAKRKLDSEYSIMELNMSPTPVITQFIPFTEQHVMLLQKRLQGF